jgi:hypothetical protein
MRYWPIAFVARACNGKGVTIRALVGDNQWRTYGLSMYVCRILSSKHVIAAVSRLNRGDILPGTVLRAHIESANEHGAYVTVANSTLLNARASICVRADISTFIRRARLPDSHNLDALNVTLPCVCTCVDMHSQLLSVTAVPSTVDVANVNRRLTLIEVSAYLCTCTTYVVQSPKTCVGATVEGQVMRIGRDNTIHFRVRVGNTTAKKRKGDKHEHEADDDDRFIRCVHAPALWYQANIIQWLRSC